jgi:transcriptional regulator with XRE-family HTH domain
MSDSVSHAPQNRGVFVPFTTDLLDLAKARQGVTSDYRLAQLVGVAQPTMTSWRRRRTRPEPQALARLAELCGINAEIALLFLQVDRAQTDGERELWLRIAEHHLALLTPDEVTALEQMTRHFVAVNNPHLNDPGRRVFLPA